MAKNEPEAAAEVYNAEVVKPKMDEISDKLLKKIEDNDDVTRLANRALKNLNGMSTAEAQSHAGSVAK
jgi:hypothetical protein